MLSLGFNGSPNNVEFKLYTGSGGSPTLQATSYAVARASLSSAVQDLTAMFSSAVAIPGGTTVRLTCHQVSSGGDASNSLFSPADFTWDPDSNSTALLPLSCQRTYWSGSAWDDSSNLAASSISPFALVLDSTAPFASSGGGGTTYQIISPIVNRFYQNEGDF